MTHWSIVNSPLVSGSNLPENDNFTHSLNTSKTVLDVLNKSTGNRPLFNDAYIAAWIARERGTGAEKLAFLTGPTGKWP